jgi:Mn-containing catalase
LPGVPEYTSVYYTCLGARTRAAHGTRELIGIVEDPQPAVETETARHACCQKADIEVLKAMATRTASDPSSDLVAGTDLRSGSAS